MEAESGGANPELPLRRIDEMERLSEWNRILRQQVFSGMLKWAAAQRPPYLD